MLTKFKCQPINLYINQITKEQGWHLHSHVSRYKNLNRMITNINIEKSISKNRVYFKRSILDMFMRYLAITFLASILPILSIIYMIDRWDTLSNDLFGQIVSNLLIFGGSIVFILIVSNSNRLTRIKTKKDKSTNIVSVVRILQNLGWEIQLSNSDMVVAIPGNWDKQVTIIFHNSDILVNSVRFGRYDFLEFNNQENLDKVLKEIEMYTC